MEGSETKTKQIKDTFKRSLVKSIGYRLIIIVLDFTTVYIFTGKVEVAVGFMLISNIYTTVVYFFYDRIWDRIKWGKRVEIN